MMIRTHRRDLWKKIIKLESEVERLRLDTARLDWLENHPLPTEVVGGCNDGLMSKTWSLREALDVVRQTTQPEPGEEE